jgi:hypothetical protein
MNLASAQSRKQAAQPASQPGLGRRVRFACSIFVLVIGNFLHGNSAIAQTPYVDIRTGNGLLTVCESQLGTHDYARCQSYIMGALAGLQSGHRLAGAGQIVCIPSAVTVGQILDIVVMHLRQNPQTRDIASELQVWAALYRAFPCPRENNQP